MTSPNYSPPPLAVPPASCITKAANPPDLRGALWSASTDDQTWTKFNSNQFDTPIPLTARYLKVGLSWQQAGSPTYGLPLPLQHRRVAPRNEAMTR